MPNMLYIDADSLELLEDGDREKINKRCNQVSDEGCEYEKDINTILDLFKQNGYSIKAYKISSCSLCVKKDCVSRKNSMQLVLDNSIDDNKINLLRKKIMRSNLNNYMKYKLCNSFSKCEHCFPIKDKEYIIESVWAFNTDNTLYFIRYLFDENIFISFPSLPEDNLQNYEEHINLDNAPQFNDDNEIIIIAQNHKDNISSVLKCTISENGKFITGYSIALAKDSEDIEFIKSTFGRDYDIVYINRWRKS